MQITITLLYGGALALVFLVLSIRVIQGRSGKDAPSLGDGGDVMLQRRVRGHANFAEYVPIILILIGFLEASGTKPWIIHSLGASLLLGRIMHGYALAFSENSVIGNPAIALPGWLGPMPGSPASSSAVASASLSDFSNVIRIYLNFLRRQGALQMRAQHAECSGDTF